MMDLKRENSRWIDEAVVFHDGIPTKEMRLLDFILPTRFIEYRFANEGLSSLNQGTLSYFSKMVFSKYECLRLLDDYKTVVWLDYDIVVLSDISELASYCRSGIKMLQTGKKVRVQFTQDIEGYDMDAPAMSTGTFVLQDHLPRYRQMLEFCYAKTEEYAERLYLPEQAIFDIMIQEYRLPVHGLDKTVYAPHPNDVKSTDTIKILHGYGQPKFWNGLSNEHWNMNYQKWLKSGGRPYRKPSAIRKVWKKLVRYWRQTS